MSAPAIEMIGAFESTYMPAHDVDVVETTEHDLRWRADIDLLAATNVRSVRYPIRWHRIEPRPGRYDWRHTDEVLGHLQARGIKPIVDLLHHTSYPLWVGHLGSPTFGPAYLRFVEAVARRYPWVPAYTVCNEPFTTFLMCGQDGHWPPHWTGLDGFVALARNVMPALSEASWRLGELLNDAEHVHVEACERHSGSGDGEAYAAYANARRFFLTDLLTGHPIDDGSPFARDILAAGGEDVMSMPPARIDVLGLDYYAHNQWHWTGPEQGSNRSPCPAPLSELIVEYSDRYGLPCMLGETNIRGYASDRASWLKYTLEQCEMASAAGVDLRGFCWFPSVDSADWSSLLREHEGAIDPVGVYWLDEQLDRRSSVMSASYALAASGTPAADLPAYRFRPPVSTWLDGWLPHMSHWQWQDPPSDDHCSQRSAADELLAYESGDERAATTASDTQIMPHSS